MPENAQVVADPQAAELFAGALPSLLKKSRPVQVLERSLASGRLAHGILLHGGDMRALESVAVALACAFFGCKPEEAETHPDFIALRPAGKMRQIRIGDRGESAENTMRGFLKQISQTPNRARRKLAVVFDADRMNIATANAFLKTLEEPPADTTILLVSTRPHDLLDTIRSRCFHFCIDVPGVKERDERWQAWLASYAEWLQRVANRPRKPEEVANAVLGLYALSQDFSDTLGVLSDENWERESAALPKDLPEEQVAALEVGCRKGLRQLLFADVEAATLDYARKGDPAAVSTRLFRAQGELERAARLCEVFNLKEDAALEAFFLASMRVWANG